MFGTAAGREGRRPDTPDARPGALGQPLNETARNVTSGAFGGLAAGALLFAIFVGADAVARDPSNLVKLRRRASAAAGWNGKQGRPRLGEQMASHGGHLALSITTGAAYGATKPDAVSPVVAGTVFGAGFYVLAYGVVGPLAGITPKLSKETGSRIVSHGMFHVMFGITMALIADRTARRL